MIVHASEAEAYEAPEPEKRVVRYLIDPERTRLRRFMTGLTTLDPGQKTVLRLTKRKKCTSF